MNPRDEAGNAEEEEEEEGTPSIGSQVSDGDQGAAGGRKGRGRTDGSAAQGQCKQSAMFDTGGANQGGRFQGLLLPGCQPPRSPAGAPGLFVC